MRFLNFLYLFILLQTANYFVSGSNITYTDITQPTYNEVTVELGITSLEHLFVMSRQFVDIVFKPFSTIEEFIYEIITSSSSSNDFLQEILSQWQTLASFEVGYMVCLVFGLLFVLFSIVGGLIMCCCRTCCKNCGGEMFQTKRRVQSKWRYCICVSFLAVLAFITVPMVFVFLTNEWVSQVVEIIPQKTIQSLNDSIIYIDSLNEQLDEVFDQYEKLDTSLRYDATNLNETLGIPIMNQFQTLAQPAFDALLQISTDTNAALLALENVENSTTDIQNGVVALNNSLSLEQESLSSDLNNSTCLNNSYCRNVFESASLLTLGGDFSSLKSVSNEIDEIQDIANSSDFENGIQSAQQQLENIPNLVAESSSNATSQLLSALDSVNETINQVQFPTESFDEITDQIRNIQNSITDAFNVYSNNFEKYRYIAGLVLGSTIALICGFYWIGLLLGVIFFKNDKMASKRSCCSNCGGILIMAGVGFSFIFAWLLMLLVIVTFTLGGHGERYVCQTLEYPYDGLKFADRFIQNPILISGAEVNISITEVITESCKNNASIYTALKLENVYNVTELYENLTQNLDSFDDNLDLDVSISVDIYTQEIQDSLDALKNTGLDGINFDAYLNATVDGLTAVNLTEYAQFLNESAMNISITESSSPFIDLIKNHSVIILEIQSTHVDPLQPAVDALETNILQLQSISDGFNETIDNTAMVLNATDNEIEVNGTSFVVDATQEFANEIITDVTDFGDWFIIQITENFGACLPMFLIYTQVVSLMCDYLIDILNGLWFCIGWCVFFMIPGVILGMKLAKFYRRMDADDEEYGDHWNNMDMEMDAFNRSNNNGNNQRSSGKFRSSKIHPGEYY